MGARGSEPGAGTACQAGEALALAPEPLAILGRLPRPRHAMCRAPSAVVPEAAGTLARLGSRAEPDDRVGSLFRAAQQRSGQPVKARQRGRDARRVHPAGVHRVHDDTAAGEPLRPQLGEDHLRALGPRVHRRSVELLARGLQVLDMEPLRVHPPRGDVDDPRRSALREQGDQQVREQERSEHVRRKRELVAVRGERPLGRQHAGVVDEDVEARLVGGEARREGPHVAQVAHVAQIRPNVAVARRLDDGSARSLPALLAAREQPDARAETGKPVGGRQAESRGRTGDEDRLAVHRPKIVRVPRTAADPVSGARIARDDRAVENRVNQGADHSSVYGTRSRIAQRDSSAATAGRLERCDTRWRAAGGTSQRTER